MRCRDLFEFFAIRIATPKQVYSERMIIMALSEVTKTTEHTDTINDAMDVLLGKLDEAIDDVENGRVQTIEEAWEEIDRVCL